MPRCVEGSTDEGPGKVRDCSIATFGATRSFDNAIVSTPSSAKYCVYSRDSLNKSSSSIAVGSAFISFSHPRSQQLSWLGSRAVTLLSHPEFDPQFHAWTSAVTRRAVGRREAE